jgi:uncharacterized protein
MLLIDIPRVPPEGLSLDEALVPEAVHLEGDPDLALRPGGRLRCHVEIVDGTTVHVRGRLEAGIEVDCSRCLERYPVAVAQELDLFSLPRPAEEPDAGEEGVELSDRDVVVGYHAGDALDLGELVREQIVLAVPMKPLCREDCRGLCPRCGRNRNLGPCGCPPDEEPGDPRLEPLRKLFDKNRQ